MYTIGKLAKLSNTTVRTLRYYDEIGLLAPSKISTGGHRYYDTLAVEKLHNIIMLKELGFELETIHEIVANQIKSLKELLQLRLEMLHAEQHKLEFQIGKVQGLLQMMEMEGNYDWEDIFKTFSSPKNNNQQNIKDRWRNYFTKEERKILNQLPNFRTDDPIIIKWVELIKDIKANLEIEPSTMEAQNLAKRWLNLVYVMYKGDWKLAQKIWDINWEKNDDLGFYEFDPEVINFIREAIVYFFAQNMDSVKQVIDYE